MSTPQSTVCSRPHLSDLCAIAMSPTRRASKCVVTVWYRARLCHPDCNPTYSRDLFWYFVERGTKSVRFPYDDAYLSLGRNSIACKIHQYGTTQNAPAPAPYPAPRGWKGLLVLRVPLVRCQLGEQRTSVVLVDKCRRITVHPGLAANPLSRPKLRVSNRRNLGQGRVTS